MVVRRCCAKECYNSQIFRKDVAYFALPKRECFAQVWALAAGRRDLLSKSMQCLSKYHICSEHFEQHCFADPPHNKNLLITKSPLFVPIPTIFKNNIGNFLPRANAPCTANTMVSSPSTPNLEVPINYGDFLNSGDITVLVIPESLAQLASQEIHKHRPVDEIIGEGEIETHVISDDDDDLPELLGTECVEIIEVGKPDENTCRLCALPFDSDELIHIFADAMVARTVKFVLSGQMMENDSLSQFVCSGCLDKANKCVKIISGFREAQQVQINMYCNIIQE